MLSQAMKRAQAKRKPLSAITSSPNFKKGQLHRDLSVPQGQNIPLAQLEAAAHKPGKVGQRARFALLLRRKSG